MIILVSADYSIKNAYNLLKPIIFLLLSADYRGLGTL
jgi:hypothetical protein